MGSKEIIEKLRAKEWEAGNGQCRDCWGTKDGFNSGWGTYNKYEMGHEKDCVVAMTLEHLGEKVLRKRLSKCISAVCSRCGADLKDDNTWMDDFKCVKCGNNLFINGVNKTFEEIIEENI